MGRFLLNNCCVKKVTFCSQLRIMYRSNLAFKWSRKRRWRLYRGSSSIRSGNLLLAGYTTYIEELLQWQPFLGQSNFLLECLPRDVRTENCSIVTWKHRLKQSHYSPHARLCDCEECQTCCLLIWETVTAYTSSWWRFQKKALCWLAAHKKMIGMMSEETILRRGCGRRGKWEI